jgi:hypothetical protein
MFFTRAAASRRRLLGTAPRRHWRSGCLGDPVGLKASEGV